MKTWHMLAVVLISAAWFVAGMRYGAADVRPTCPKSGGTCDCVRCMCDPGCPGVCAKKCCEPRKAHIINPDGTQEHRPLTPDEEEQLRPMTVEEFKKFQDELRKEIEARKK